MNGNGNRRGSRLWCREIAAAWFVGGGIWIAGLGGLAALSGADAEGARTAVGGGLSSYLQPSDTWSTYQDPSGKYRVVERTYRRVPAN